MSIIIQSKLKKSINKMNYSSQIKHQIKQPHIIHTTQIDIYNFTLPHETVVSHFRQFTTKNHELFLEKPCKINYLIISENLELIKNLTHLISRIQFSDQYNVSVVGVNSEREAEQHIKMLEQICGNQFQSKYMEMVASMEKSIEVEMIKIFCKEELGWSDSRICSFVEKGRDAVNSIDRLLSFKGFSYLENCKLEELKDFMQIVLNSENDQGQ